MPMSMHNNHTLLLLTASMPQSHAKAGERNAILSPPVCLLELQDLTRISSANGEEQKSLEGQNYWKRDITAIQL